MSLQIRTFPVVPAPACANPRIPVVALLAQITASPVPSLQTARFRVVPVEALLARSATIPAPAALNPCEQRKGLIPSSEQVESTSGSPGPVPLGMTFKEEALPPPLELLPPAPVVV